MAEYKRQLIVGDRRTPLKFRLYDDGQDNDLSGGTVTFDMYAADGTHTVDSGSCTVQPTATFTADTTNNYYVANAHGMENGWEVILTTTGTLPAPLATSTRYFVINATQNYFQLAKSKNGADITPTDTGSGTHSFAVLGQVSYAWASADVDTAGTYKGWFTVTEGGVSDTFPNDSTGIAIVIAEVG